MPMSRRNAAVSRDYLYFSVIATVMVLLVTGLVIISTYKYIIQDREFQLHGNAHLIADRLNGSLDGINEISNYISELILALPKLEPKAIQQTLDKHLYLFNHNYFFLNHANIYWVDAEGTALLSKHEGILALPWKVDIPNYVSLTKQLPHKLKILHLPISENATNQALYLAYPVYRNKNYVGSLMTIIPINTIIQSLGEVLRSDISSFLVLDREYHVIIQHPRFLIDHEAGLDLDQLIFNIDENEVDNGYLPGNFKIGNHRFSFYLLNYRYPFTILTGEDLVVSRNNLKLVVYPRLMESGFIILFVMLILYIFRFKVLKPMLDLASFAEQISAGNLNVKLPAVDSREAEVMARALQLVKYSLYREQRLKNQLIEARDKAKRISDEKTKLIRHVTHDVRSPLASASGMAQIIHLQLLGPIENPKYIEYASDILTIISHIEEVVNDLLNLEELEAKGHMVLKNERIVVEELINKAIFVMAKRAEAKQIAINVFLPEENKYGLVANANQLLRMLINIISNSIKYSPENSEVRIMLEATKRRFRISVVDEGVGIKDIEAALTPFNDESNTHDISFSAGLGLSLVKNTMEHMYGGKLIIESTKDQGCTVIFEFPEERVVTLDEEMPGVVA